MMHASTSLTSAPTPPRFCPRSIRPSHQRYSTRPSPLLQKRDGTAPPPGSWDAHMHLIDPAAFPLSPNAIYTPPAHTLPQALSFYSSHPLLAPLANLVIVQPSIYGADNSCTLAALRALGPDRARAVVTLPPDAGPEMLFAWHALGVRGVRLNFKSVGRAVTADELGRELRAAADAVRGFGWAVQVYLGLESMPLLENVVRQDPPLGVRVVIDHLGHPTLPEAISGGSADQGTKGGATAPHDPYALPGFANLVRLLSGDGDSASCRKSSTWVKLSGAYRIESDPALPWTSAMARELLRVAPERVVFATDWPHTRFEGYDVVPFVQRCLEWCAGDERVVERVFRQNAEELFDVRR
ncbi:transcriptional regulator [Phyllosticta citricarpa]|uniref:Transcriptional regulator n=1 Tax=Phyllosticta citricarpa TaxID=55181 RepID=A0ABR1LKZ7_9PEZI